MELSLQRGQSRGSAWTRWALCALLAWPVVQAYAAPSDASMIHGPPLEVAYGQNYAINTAGQLKCWCNTKNWDTHRSANFRVFPLVGCPRLSFAQKTDFLVQKNYFSSLLELAK